MESYLWIRFAKLIFVGLWFAGGLGTVLSKDLEARKLFAHRVAAPAWLGCVLLGFAMASVLHSDLLSAWVIGGLATSLVGQVAMAYVASRQERRRAIPAASVLASLVATVMWMVFRPH